MSLLQKLYNNLAIAEELIEEEIDICLMENKYLTNLEDLKSVINRMQMIIDGSVEPEE
jgi:hypothetical protein